MENPIKMDDLGVPLFWKHPYHVTQGLGMLKPTKGIPMGKNERLFNSGSPSPTKM